MFIAVVIFVLIRITHDAVLQADSNPTSDPRPSAAPDQHSSQQQEVAPCSDFDIEDVWVQNFPKLITETAFRLVDVNKDDVLDVVMGFSTGVTSYFADQYLVCDIYFNGSWPCFGGLMALDGRTGSELWRHYTTQEMFGINCNVDIDQDGVKDCLGAGRAGTFELVSGATGHLLWKFQSDDLLVSISNLYTPQFIRDVDGDGVQDVLNIHGGDPLRKRGHEVSHIGILLVISGATGHVIAWIEVPDKQESYYSPQVYYQHGGREMVLFGSGGESKGGSLWVIAMADLLQGDNSKATRIYTDNVKGIMTPPALVDITGDGVVDIVMAMFNSTVVAFDGQSYSQLWNYSFAESETYSTPGVAYYNDDNIPDFMVVYNHGPGYPVYYYSQVAILDGRNGQPLLTSAIQTAGSSNVSPLSLSMEGHGNDAFMYFVLDCLGHEAEMQTFKFAKDDEDVGIGKLSRSDFCKQRFNTEDYSRMYLLNRDMMPPGKQIYNSLDRKSDEYQYNINSSLLAKAYLDKHPNVLEKVKELVLENLNDHNSDQSGSLHSEERGDQNWDGRAHSDGREGSDLVDVPNEQFHDLDGGFNPLPKQQDQTATNRLAPRLGFDNEDELPIFEPPVDLQPSEDQRQPSQPVPDSQDVDSRDPDPSQNHSQKPNPQGADPLDFYPEDRYPQSPSQSLDSDGRLSQKLLDELLNQLLQDDQLSDADDSLVDDVRGYPINKGHLGPSGPLAGSSDWQHPARPSDPRKKSYYGDLFDTQSETNGRGQYNRYGNRQGYEDSGSPYGRVSNADRDETKKWLDRMYGSPSQEGFSNPSKRYFRKRRGAGHMHRPPFLPLHDLVKELFQRLETRKTGKGEAVDEEHVSGPTNERKPPLIPLEYLDKELYQKLEGRGTRKEKPRNEDQHTRGATELTGQSAHLGGPFKRVHGSRASPRRGRHAGPHDAGGVQRLISTGTLAPVLPGQADSAGDSMDLVFATYWFYPSDTQIILPEQQQCIDEWMAKETQRMNPKSVFYGLDHDAYEHMAMDKCTEGTTRKQREEYVSRLGPLDIYPFNIHTGELTVYRLRLTCRCKKQSANQRCAKVLPYDEQRWAAYMGTYGNSHFRAQ
ncbi:uncharacterized protein LOC110989995 [Acanthaster planci]|uniref:Uncharacterized protein LOC110989995 n=1 Tax=Acanthaster planci TaxID=133434 RepID=A0A8B7ZYD9_ACAPL|nr:uncharacterized protein LOC110989995 [Acanthaster planci]